MSFWFIPAQEVALTNKRQPQAAQINLIVNGYYFRTSKP